MEEGEEEDQKAYCKPSHLHAAPSRGAADTGMAQPASSGSEQLLVLAVECSRNRNIGPLVRTASALGVSLVIIVGAQVVSTHGAHGAQSRVQIKHFFYWHEVSAFLRSRSGGCVMYGISTSPLAATDHSSASVALESSALAHASTVAFVMGEKEIGLTDDIRGILDMSLHVDFPFPQYACRLTLESIFGICLHHFVSTNLDRIQLQQRGVQGEKYVLGATFKNDRKEQALEQEVRDNKRAARAVLAEAEMAVEEDLSCLASLLGL